MHNTLHFFSYIIKSYEDCDFSYAVDKGVFSFFGCILAQNLCFDFKEDEYFDEITVDLFSGTIDFILSNPYIKRTLLLSPNIVY